jgi:hypothetical protein
VLVAKYFVFVGGVLVALLLVASCILPEPRTVFSDRPQTLERTSIRIESNRKWPEMIVLDTSHSAMIPPVAEPLPAAQPGTVPPIEVPDKLIGAASIPPKVPTGRVTANRVRREKRRQKGIHVS